MPKFYVYAFLHIYVILEIAELTKLAKLSVGVLLFLAPAGSSDPVGVLSLWCYNQP